MNRHANRIAKAKRKLQDALKRGDTRAQHHALAKLQKATTAALKYEVANGPIQSKAPAGESLGGLFDALGAW